MKACLVKPLLVSTPARRARGLGAVPFGMRAPVRPSAVLARPRAATSPVPYISAPGMPSLRFVEPTYSAAHAKKKPWWKKALEALTAPAKLAPYGAAVLATAFAAPYAIRGAEAAFAAGKRAFAPKPAPPGTGPATPEDAAYQAFQQFQKEQQGRGINWKEIFGPGVQSGSANSIPTTGAPTGSDTPSGGGGGGGAPAGSTEAEPTEASAAASPFPLMLAAGLGLVLLTGATKRR